MADSTNNPMDSLVRTQRAAIKSYKTKRDLGGLALKLLSQHGTGEERALRRSEIEAKKRREIEALVAELSIRAQQRKRVHLSELGGWPVCWDEKRREKVKPRELLRTPITVVEEAVTCARCKRAAELPSPEETAALKRAEAEANETPTKQTGSNGRRAKRKLDLKKNLTVRMKVKDVEARGVVRPDGTMSVKGRSYASPHAAANALAGDRVSYRIDGFQAWRFQAEDGRWRMLREYA
ncbi:MAG TPA: hypothetical protein DEA08_06335 [Planctomycetes bacterium]|nr:hypothetical protein [Planctomycetota bacterium]